MTAELEAAKSVIPTHVLSQASVSCSVVLQQALPAMCVLASSVRSVAADANGSSDASLWDAGHLRNVPNPSIGASGGMATNRFNSSVSSPSLVGITDPVFQATLRRMDLCSRAPHAAVETSVFEAFAWLRRLASVASGMRAVVADALTEDLGQAFVGALAAALACGQWS